MVDNHILEEKIHDFIENQTEKKFVEVMEMLEKATVYVPAVPPANMPQEMIEKMKAGETIPASPLVKPMPFLLKKTDGQSVLPVFTSKSQIPEDRKSPLLLYMPYLACVSIVMNNADKIAEISLNPFTEGLTINKPPIEVAYRRMQRDNNRERQIQEVHEREKQMGQNPKAMEQVNADAKTVQMTEREFRKLANKQVAENMLPMLFLSNPALALEQLLSQKEAFLLDMYGTFFPDRKLCSYTEEDFSVMALTVSDTLQVVRIDLPEVKPAQDSILRVYLASDLEHANELKYYIVARSNEGEINRIVRIFEDKHMEELMTLEDYGSELSEVIELASK